mgnify:CR=1 FL=1
MAPARSGGNPRPAPETCADIELETRNQKPETRNLFDGPAPVERVGEDSQDGEPPAPAPKQVRTYTDQIKKLADLKINITAVDAVVAGKGRWGAILWVKPQVYGRLLSCAQALYER